MTKEKILLSILLLMFIFNALLADNCMYIDYRGRTDNNQNCSRNKVCHRDFQLSSINIPPYSTANILESMLQKCCGRCIKLNHTNMFKNISEMSKELVEGSDFILPFVGKSSAKTLYGYHFIPIVDAPSVFYFTPKHRTVMGELIIGCLNLYPIIIVCLLMAVISGFVIWLIETRNNQTHFPRSFVKGIFEGFWYSFISMTTVGFGDRITKSTPGRLFSIVWILVGIIMFSLLTSLFTAEILKVSEPHDHSMSGANVGALKYRDYDALVIVKNHGIVKETNGWNFHSDVMELIRMLRTDEIDGFVLDKYTLAYTTEYLTWKEKNDDFIITQNKSTFETYEERKEDIEFFLTRTYRHLKVYNHEQLSYGVLVKYKTDYEFFRHAIQDNRLSLEALVGSLMNEQFPRDYKEDIFSSDGVYYQRTIKAIGGVLAVIGLFGLSFEFYYRRGGLCWSDLKEKQKLVVVNQI